VFTQRIRRHSEHGPFFCALALAGGIVLPSIVYAQDSQQGTLQYGPQGTLLDGAIIGGVSDLSAAYYNPGALVLLSNPRFAASLVSVTWDRLEIEDVGTGLTFASQPVSIHPDLVAGSIDHTGRAAIAWSFLMRQQLDYDFAESKVTIEVPAGERASALYARRRQRIREYWAGPTWSYRLASRAAVGVSAFGAYRLQRLRRIGLVDEAGGNGSAAASAMLEQEYDYVRLLAKVGLAWRPGRFELGATVTTPGFAVWSAGRVRSIVSVTAPNDTPLLGGVDQEGLKADYRPPWSIGGGGTWRGQRTAAHVSAEWYLAIETAAILAAQPGQIYGSEAQYPVSLFGGRKSALWIAAGLEHHLSDSTSLCASASRDPSSGVAGGDTFSTMGITSVGAGVLFPVRKARVGLGIRFGWGQGPSSSVNPIPGERPADGSTVSIRRISFTFGTANRSGI